MKWDKSNNHVKRHDKCSKNALNIKDVDVFVERNNYIYITKPWIKSKWTCEKDNTKLKLRKGLDTVESLSVEVKGSKVANFTVLVTLLPTFVTYFCPFGFFGRSYQKDHLLCLCFSPQLCWINDTNTLIKADFSNFIQKKTSSFFQFSVHLRHP